MQQLPIGYFAILPEVIYTDLGPEAIIRADFSIVEVLRERALSSDKKRCRLCTHQNSDALQQEMLIVMHKDSYVAPHRHKGKSETFTVLEGEVDALIFDESGNLIEILPMGPYGSGKNFFYRMPENVYHTMTFKTDWLVYLETTIGPFDKLTSQSPDWAPNENEPELGFEFISNAVTGFKPVH